VQNSTIRTASAAVTMRVRANQANVIRGTYFPVDAANVFENGE
jgi:hypothetical protein